MTSCSTVMPDKDIRPTTKRDTSLSCCGLLAVLSSAVILFVMMQAVEANTEPREVIIRNILIDLQLEHFANVRLRGRTFGVVIKNFTEEDKETYLIIPALRKFYVISISDKRNNPICGSACSSVFPLSKARKELITLTKANGLSRQFTVPTKKMELPTQAQ